MLTHVFLYALRIRASWLLISYVLSIWRDQKEPQEVELRVVDLKKLVRMSFPPICYNGWSISYLFFSELHKATINNSLMTLRKCVEILRSNQASRASGGQSLQQIVPYRDCKLTRLFKSFFEGNGQVGILVCVHPTNEEYTETLVGAHLQLMESSE